MKWRRSKKNTHLHRTEQLSTVSKFVSVNTGTRPTRASCGTVNIMSSTSRPGSRKKEGNNSTTKSQVQKSTDLKKKHVNVKLQRSTQLSPFKTRGTRLEMLGRHRTRLIMTVHVHEHSGQRALQRQLIPYARSYHSRGLDPQPQIRSALERISGSN